MALVARWADDLAHEIKNPFHAMVINLELVKRRAREEGDGLVERTEVVESELHRVHDLVDSLLRLVRPWPDTPRSDAGRILEQLQPVLAARARVRQIDYRHEGGQASMPLAPGELALVILNLVDNALQASPPEGAVTTRCDMADGAATLTIRDQGPGLEPGFQPDAAALSDEDGRGLAVVARLVERAGGTLLFDSSGTGTVVTVSVPQPQSA